MSKSPSSEREVVGINEIKPYWRNPRLIPEDAVEAVMASIKEFGYLQPIVTDKQGVIVVGTTRYIAARRLEMEEVEVIKVDLTQRQAKELRIIDNRASEYSTWDYSKLEPELEGLDSESLKLLFPEPEAGIEFDMAESFEEEGTPNNQDIEFICPHCFHEWERSVTKDEIFSGKIEAKR